MELNQKFEKVEIGKLRAHPRNPRNGNTEAIKESIEVNGFYGAVIAQKSTGYILAGNHRWRAAKEAGSTHVPVAWIDVEEEHATRIMLADNRTNDMASYNESELASLLTELSESIGFDGTGYTAADLDLLLDGIPVEDLDAMEEWVGMPEFDMKDKTAFQSIIVHCKDQASLDLFCKTIGQSVTDKTKMLWFPKAEIGHAADKVYK